MRTEMNPWAGLASYQDPAAGSTLLFCGRDNESYDLAALADDNIFCTLYGKSGTGKTSLLNAGMFPRLRAMGYLPLSIRLGMEAMDTTFQQCIAARLGKAATLQTSEAVTLPASDQDERWLWAWFARTRFVDAEGKTCFPVLVFDQFEEVFRSRRAEAETLLRQIHFMMDPSHSLGDDYDYNFRFLASIREDDLYLLEDSLDRHFMGDMKQCRYRLNSLTDEGAREVILKPGEGLFAAGEQDAIVDTVIGIARSADGSINTNILSLVCSRIYDHYRRSGDSNISLDLVRRFVSSNPFEQFYNEVTADLSEREKQFIEDRLVDAAGRRGSVSEPDFEKNVPSGAHLLEGTGRILQRVASGTEGRSYRIELIHDSFCAPLADQKLKRAARRRRRIIAALSAVALVVAAVAAYIVVASIRNARQTREILIQQEKFYAKQASQLLDEGDTYTALLLLNELTDPDGPFAKISLVPEAEFQMRRAITMYDTAEWRVAKSWKFEDYVYNAQSTSNGRYLLYSTLGGVKVVDYRTGEVLRTLKTPSFNLSVPQFTISHDEKLVAAQAIDLANACDDLLVFDIETGKVDPIHLLNHQNHAFGTSGGGGYSFNQRSLMFFSLDDKSIIHLVDTVIQWQWAGHKIRAFDYASGKVCYDFEKGDDNPYVIEDGNINGQYVASRTRKGEIIIHDKTTGSIITHFRIDNCLVWKYINDDALITINDNAVLKYDVSSGEKKRVINRGFDMRVLGDAQVSETELLLSNVDTVFLYDLYSYQLKSFYKVDTVKFHEVVLNKNKESNIFLIDKFGGKILSLEHQKKKKDEEIVGFRHYYTRVFLCDSLLLDMIQGDDSTEWSQIEVRRVKDNTIKLSDSVKGSLTFDGISPNRRYALFTLINYKYNEMGDIIDTEEDSTSGLVWKLFDTEKGTITSVGDIVAHWRYPFFIDDENFVFFDTYDKMTYYNILSGDTSLFMDGVDVVYEKDRCSNGLILCENGAWFIFNPKEKNLKKMEVFSCYRSKFTIDGNYILASSINGMIGLYRFPSMELVDKRKGYRSFISAFSPDGNYAVLSSELDGKEKLELWSLFPLHIVGEIDSRLYTAGHVIFNSKGDSIIYYSGAITENGEVGFVRVPIIGKDELIKRARAITGGRKLTEEEKNLLME